MTFDWVIFSESNYVKILEGKLIDFTRPPYNKWAGFNSAVQNNDTIQTTPEID